MIYDITVAVRLTAEHLEGHIASRHIATDFNIDVSDNLDKAAYLDDDLPTEQGCSAITQVLIQGLIANINLAKAKGWRDTAGHLTHIIQSLSKGAAQGADITEGTFDDSPADREKPKHMSTNIELVAELEKLNTSHKYDRLIKNARDNHYHNFKAPEDVVCGKVLLVEHLSDFPELAEIRQKVINGVYDESPDEADREAMRKDTPKGLWDTLGLN